MSLATWLNETSGPHPGDRIRVEDYAGVREWTGTVLDVFPPARHVSTKLLVLPDRGEPRVVPAWRTTKLEVR